VQDARCRKRDAGYLVSWIMDQQHAVLPHLGSASSGKNALFDQTFPEQLYHLTPLIFKNVRWSIKNGEEWSSSLFPPAKTNKQTTLLLKCVNFLD